MNKKETLALIGSHKLNSASGPAAYQFCHPFMLGFMRMRNHHKQYPKGAILMFKDEITTFATLAAQDIKDIKQLYQSPERTARVIRRWQATKEVLVEYCNGEVQNLGRISDEELYKKYSKLMNNLADALAAPMACEHMGVYTEGELLKEFLTAVQNRKLDQSTLMAHYGILSQPAYTSFTAKNQAGILRLALLCKKGSKQLERKLKEHKSKYFWAENNYLRIKSLSEQHFLRMAEEEAKRTASDIKRQIRSFSGENCIRARQKALIRMLRLDRRISEALLLTQELGKWWDKKKELTLRANHCLNKILKEIAKRKRYELKEVCRLTYEEVRGLLLRNRRPDKEQLAKRAEAVVHAIEQPEKTAIFEGKDAKEIITLFESIPSGSSIKGTVASFGKAKTIAGEVQIVLNAEKARFKEGKILVATMTRPEFVPLMKKAKAIITDEGGITSHAAIISRELGIPCIIGTGNATRLLRDKEHIELDMQTGQVRATKQH